MPVAKGGAVARYCEYAGPEAHPVKHRPDRITLKQVLNRADGFIELNCCRAKRKKSQVLVELISAGARFQESKPTGSWNLELKNLRSQLSEADSPGYWGHFSTMGDGNLVSDLDSYPWMPMDISLDPSF
jgi:hypothetical protein